MYVQVDDILRMHKSEQLLQTIRNFKPDVFLHCAAATTSNHSEAEFEKINIKFTESCALLCKVTDVPKFLFVSSVPIAKFSKNELINEDSPSLPRTPYHWSKYKAEAMLQEKFGDSLNFNVLRISAPVGRYMNTSRLISYLIKCLEEEINPILLKDGSRIQNYIDIRDFGHLVMHSSALDSGELYVVPGRTTISNFDLAKLVIEKKKHLGLDVCFDQKWDPVNDERWKIDGTKIYSKLYWRPKYSISETIDFLRKDTHE
jgi:nucleoside-diphosphate-sugar epimerase